MGIIGVGVLCNFLEMIPRGPHGNKMAAKYLLGNAVRAFE